MTTKLAAVEVTRHEKGRVLKIGPMKFVILEDGRLTSDRLGIVEGILPPNQKGPPERFHNMHDATFLVTKGAIRFTSGADHHDLNAGDFILVPVHAPHTFENTTDAEARFITTYTPAFYVHYLELLAEYSASGTRMTNEQHTEALARYATFESSKLKKSDKLQ